MQSKIGGGGGKKTEYGANLELSNCTREKSDWYTEDYLDGLLETEHGSHPELAAEFPGLILEEDIPGPVADVET